MAEAADAIRSAVTEAVRAHLRCIGTPEIELSGGWDSSTVALSRTSCTQPATAPTSSFPRSSFPTIRL